MKQEITKESKSKEIGKKRKSAQFVLASLDRRAKQLELMLKLTKPISQFVKRVEYLEHKLNEYSSNSPPSQSSSQSCSSEKNYIHKHFLPSNEALGDLALLKKIAKTYMATSAQSIIFSDENELFSDMNDNLFLKCIMIASCSSIVRDDTGYNLKDVEDYALKTAKTLIPDAYLNPSVSNMHAFLTLAFYYFRLRKIFSADKYTDAAFQMFQTIAIKSGLVNEGSDLPDFFKSSDLHLDHTGVFSERLSKTWSILKLAKQYIAILSGKPLLIKDTKTTMDNFIKNMDFLNEEDPTKFKSASLYSMLADKMIQYTFYINSKIYIDNITPGSPEFYRLIKDNINDIQALENVMYEWQTTIIKPDFNPNDFKSIQMVVEGTCTIEERTTLFNYFFINFFIIILHWPTILCYKVPLPKDYPGFIDIFNSAMELFNMLKNWDHLITQNKIVPISGQLPFSIRTVFMASMVFLNHMYHSSETSPSSANLSKQRIIFLEDFLIRYAFLFEESEITLGDLREAKITFRFDKLI